MRATASRVTSTPGRTDASLSPVMRSVSPEKNRKIWPARAVSATPSASVLPSSRARRYPISALRARISSPMRLRMSWRTCGVERDQNGKASLAAAMACAASARVARGKWPTTSFVFEGLRSGALGRLDPFTRDEVLGPDGHAFVLCNSRPAARACS